MSAKKYDNDDGDFEEEEYVEDDDDEDEDDFHPDDDDDDDNEEDEDEGGVSYLDGSLSYDGERRIHYKGIGFHLESVSAVSWNILDKSNTPQNDSLVVEMIGPCDVVSDESSSRKPTPRKIRTTFVVSDPKQDQSQHFKNAADNDESEKQPSTIFQVYGNEIGNPGHSIEFKGVFSPVSDGKEVKLLCQVRTTDARPAVEVAAVAAGKNNRDDEDDDDIDEDGVDYNELIALREDASLSVDALRKRYRSQGQQDDHQNGEENGTKKSNVGKTKYDDDDDDDDVEF
jgi:hypothetical protein